MPVLELEYRTLETEAPSGTSSMDERMGYGVCAQCNCQGYRDAGYNNDICVCTHMYSEHS